MDNKFYSSTGVKRLTYIAKYLDCIYVDGNIKDLIIIGVNTPEEAKDNEIVFLCEGVPIDKIRNTKASACVLTEKDLDQARLVNKTLPMLISADPYYSYCKAVELFYKPKEYLKENKWLNNNDVQIGNNVFIHHSVTIGKNVVIGNGTTINHGVIIGDDSIIGNNVSISYAIIGNRTKIASSCVIGEDGFCFAYHKKKRYRIFHLGRVIIKDDVTISSNTAIDRGFIGDTYIGENVVIGSLVRVAHDVKIGSGSIIVCQVGIAGSASIGENCLIAGQAGIADHVNIGNKSKVAAQSGVTKNVAAGVCVGGYPARPINQWRKESVLLKQLTKS